MTFTDDFSKYTYVYLLKNKSNVFDVFQVYIKEVENQFDRKKSRDLKVIEVRNMNHLALIHILSRWE